MLASAVTTRRWPEKDDTAKEDTGHFASRYEVDHMSPHAAQRSNTVILFGITGDLAYKKLLPALYELTVDGIRPRVIGVARILRSRSDI